MTYTEWHTTIRHREHGDKLDRDPKGYFAAVELLERIEKALGEAGVSEERKLIEWLLGRDTGASSKTIAGWLGIGKCGRDYPHDCNDFGRCWRLLEAMDWFERVPELAEINGHWAVIVEHWSELSDAWSRKAGEEVYAILKRIEPEGYERDGYEVIRNSTGGLSMATKKDASIFDIGGAKMSMGF